MSPSNKDLIKCAFNDCGHSCLRPDNEYPTKETPPDKIKVVMGDRSRSMYCTGCHRYTVYASSTEEFEHKSEKYKAKKPS